MYSNYLSTLNGSLNLHAKHLPYRPWRCQYAPLPPCAKPPKAGLSEARHRFYAHTRQGASHRASSPGNSGLAPDFLRMALLVSRWKSKPASLPTLPMSYRCSLQWGRQAPSGNNVVVLAAPHSLHFQWGGGTGASWQKRVGRLALSGILPPDRRDLDAPRTGGATWLQFAATGKKKRPLGKAAILLCFLSPLLDECIMLVVGLNQAPPLLLPDQAVAALSSSYHFCPTFFLPWMVLD